MGHFAEIYFNAPVNELGEKIISKVDETHDWKDVVEYYQEHQFLTDFVKCNCANYLFCLHPNYKDSGWNWDNENKVWKIAITFKDRGELDWLTEALKNFLPYIISTSEIEMLIDHELWEDYYTGKKSEPEKIIIKKNRN